MSLNSISPVFTSLQQLNTEQHRLEYSDNLPTDLEISACAGLCVAYAIVGVVAVCLLPPLWVLCAMYVAAVTLPFLFEVGVHCYEKYQKKIKSQRIKDLLNQLQTLSKEEPMITISQNDFERWSPGINFYNKFKAALESLMTKNPANQQVSMPIGLFNLNPITLTPSAPPLN